MAKQFYNREAFLELKEAYESIEPRYRRLQTEWWEYKFKNETAIEFARHGFLRRLKTIRRCIDNAFRLVSPNARKTPTDRRLSDADINIQAFYANLYGAIDNLAWAWVYERGLSFRRSKVGLRTNHVELRATFSQAFRDYLASRDGWMGYVIEYRDALAHRIPLYVPPGLVKPKDQDAYNDFERRKVHALYVREDPAAYQSLSSKQSKLLTFRPIITHSLTEAKGWYPFHKQMLIDFLTIEEMADMMLDEFERRP